LPSGINASDIDFAIISHAHVDHSAYLPKLIKDGFKGSVYVTPATRDLMGVILPDSGYLQEEEAKRKNARLDKANAPDDASAPASLKLNSKVNSKGKNPQLVPASLQSRLPPRMLLARLLLRASLRSTPRKRPRPV
jgi:Cft2 family RNA processing exonuclease